MTVGVCVNAHGDPRVADDFPRVEVPIDATRARDYAVRWTPTDLSFVDE